MSVEMVMWMRKLWQMRQLSYLLPKDMNPIWQLMVITLDSVPIYSQQTPCFNWNICTG